MQKGVSLPLVTLATASHTFAFCNSCDFALSVEIVHLEIYLCVFRRKRITLTVTVDHYALTFAHIQLSGLQVKVLDANLIKEGDMVFYKVGKSATHPETAGAEHCRASIVFCIRVAQQVSDLQGPSTRHAEHSL